MGNLKTTQVKPEVDRGCIGFVLLIVLVINASHEALFIQDTGGGKNKKASEEIDENKNFEDNQ
ncbi:MAG TPA: hypothetical protein DCW97_06485 [Acidobacteria bacterium]|nr:hypothetical protein [Acidobacteriota bacterium]